MAAYEERPHMIDEMAEREAQAFLDRQEMAFLECAISLMVTRRSVDEVARILCKQAEMLLEHS